ncbi:GP160 protein, partial [Polypterus senegalus]
MRTLALQNCSGDVELCTPEALISYISSVLLVLTGKSLLNVVIVGLHLQHMVKSFMGYFCISLALLDILLCVCLSLIYYFEDFTFLGFRFTKYHICLVIQIVSYTYGILHWPVLALAGIDYFLMLPLYTHPLSFARKMTCITLTIALWISALFYVFVFSDFHPIMQDMSHVFMYQCLIFTSHQCSSVTTIIMFLLLCTILYCRSGFINLMKSLGSLSVYEGPPWSLSYTSQWEESAMRKQLLSNITLCFLATWMPFIFLQAVVLFLRADIPAYLDLNVPWLCFLNSFLIGTVYWLRNQEVGMKSSAFPDGFCCWNFSYSLENETHLVPNSKSLITTVIITP